jgi:hypothetical protein
MAPVFCPFPDAWPAILADVRACSADFQINLVLDVQGETILPRNYEGFSIEANFMTPMDLSDYVEALRKSGYIVRVFLDEVEPLPRALDHLAMERAYFATASVQDRFNDGGRRSKAPRGDAHLLSGGEI